jgi:hypothetical protein
MMKMKRIRISRRLVRTRVVPAGLLVIAAAGGLACRPGRGNAPGPVAPGASVTLVADEAEAALAILAARAAGSTVSDTLWDALWSSVGYRRLGLRELAMGRAFSDSQFRRFLESDTLAARREALERTLVSWKRADVASAAQRAAAYLPRGTGLRALLLPLVKPQTNSFVFDTGTDSAAIFLYLDPAVSREQLEVTLAHELHHIGYAIACAASDDPTLTEAQRTARTWLGAFGEGVAVLAAAGGPATHPHVSSDSADRERWDRDYQRIATDLPRVEAFFLDILEGRLAEPTEVRRRAMTFFGDAQGPWYTIGYAMAATIERMNGREALVGSLCDGREFLRRYNAAAARANAAPSATGRLPLWSDGVIARLGQ